MPDINIPKMTKSYEKLRLLMGLSPNSKETKRALHAVSSKALLRELQRRNAMPPIPTERHYDVDSPAIIGWATDDQLIEECNGRDITVTNPDALRLIASGIDELDWDAVKEGYAIL